MAKHERPILPFTLHGQRHLIGCALLAAAFLLALALYLQWGRVRDLRAALAEPLPYTLATDHLAVSPDPAWGAHAVLDEGATQAILLRERPEGEGAVALLQSTRAPALAARALDLSPAVLATKLTASHAAFLGRAQSVRLLGVETRPYRAGVTAAHFFFDADDDHGEGVLFYVGDVEYLFWGHRGGAGSPPLGPLLTAVGGAVTLPEGLRDGFDRPVIDTNALTFGRTRAIAEEAARERAAALAAAGRGALVPALAHHRKALRLYASIREEDRLLDSPEAARFQALAERRRHQLDDWFDGLDRALRMGDAEAARAQARHIRDNATLEGEAGDRLRAEAALRGLPPPPQP